MPVQRRGCVLDLETAPDKHSVILAGRRGKTPAGTPLHAIVNASLLAFEEGDDGTCFGFELSSYHASLDDEAEIVERVEAELGRVRDARGRVVTFNGTAHDLPLLRQRRLRWWRFATDEAGFLLDMEPERHSDVMLELSTEGRMRWPSLADACASLGFSIRGSAGQSAAPETPLELAKCEIDVLATMVLYLHSSSQRRRSPVPVLRGLPELGRFARDRAARGPHLERFAMSPLLNDGNQQAWGARA